MSNTPEPGPKTTPRPGAKAGQATPAPPRTSLWRTIIPLIPLVILLVFVAQNTQSTSVTVLVWQFETSLISVILASFLGGLIVGLFWDRMRRR